MKKSKENNNTPMAISCALRISQNIINHTLLMKPVSETSTLGHSVDCESSFSV